MFCLIILDARFRGHDGPEGTPLYNPPFKKGG